jgi:predicted neutral ceramidase superfamily lipid hydrolase
MNDPSNLPHDERMARDPQYREAWEAALVDRHNPKRNPDDHDFHDELWLRAEIIKAGDKKTAAMLTAASREIARLEAENQVLRDRVEVAVAALARHRPLPKGKPE